MPSTNQSAIFIALRLLRPGGRNFGSMSVFMSIGGIVLGVASLIVVMSTMNGFEREVRQYALGISSHGVLFDPSGKFSNWKELQVQIEKIDTVQTMTPYLSQGAMINHNGRIKGVIVEGIVPKSEELVTDIKKFSINASYKMLDQIENSALIGQELALKLKVSVDDNVAIMVPQWNKNGNFAGPAFKKLKIVGVINTGMADYDNRILMTSLTTSQKLFSHQNNISGFRIKLRSAENAASKLEQIRITLPRNLSAIDWTQYNYQFFKAIQSQKRILFIVLMLIVTIAAFSITSNVLLMVHKKANTIIILKSLGATKLHVTLIFLLHGSLIGLLGACVGTAIGWVIALNAGRMIELLGNLLERDLINPDVYLISYLPTYVSARDVVIIFLSCLFITIVASIYPAYRASSVNPAKGLTTE